MERIIDSLDIVVFVVLLLLAAFLLFTGAGTGIDVGQEAIADARAAVVEVNEILDDRGYAAEPGAEILAALTEIPERVDRQWVPEARSYEMRAKLFHHPQALEDLREGRGLELRFSAPVGVVADATPGLIRIGWELPEGDTVSAGGYRIYRRQSGGEDRMIAEVTGKRSYEDRDVEPGRLYVYRVTALADDAVLRRSGKTESERSGPAEVRGARDWQLRPLRFDAEKKELRFMVRKFISGVWHEKEFSAAAGKAVGSADPGSGIDYRTGATFVRVDVRREKVEDERELVEFELDGKVRLEAGKPVQERVKQERIVETRIAVIRNELGEEERLNFDSP